MVVGVAGEADVERSPSTSPRAPGIAGAMRGAEARAVEIDTRLLRPDLLGVAGGRAWVREEERNLLVAFDVEAGEETFRREGARRVHVLDDVVLIEQGGEVTALDPASGEARRAGTRPAAALADVTPRHLLCVLGRDGVMALDLATGAVTGDIRLAAAPLPGVATAAEEVAFRLDDGSVVVLALDGAEARVARVLDVQRAPRDAMLPPLSTPGGMLVPVVEATAGGPRTRLLALDGGALAVQAEVDLAAQIARADGDLTALSDGDRTLVLGPARRIELPGVVAALRAPYVITRRDDAWFLGVIGAGAALRAALPAVPGARAVALGPRAIVWCAEARLGLLPLASIPLADGAAVGMAIEARAEIEAAEVTFVSPRGFLSLTSPRFGRLTALVPDVSGFRKGDRAALLETPALPASRTVRAIERLAPGADPAVVTRRSLAAPGASFAPQQAAPGLDPLPRSRRAARGVDAPRGDDAARDHALRRDARGWASHGLLARRIQPPRGRARRRLRGQRLPSCARRGPGSRLLPRPRGARIGRMDRA